jgi:glycosyltransferase involved in cell wall biosynthesis
MTEAKNNPLVSIIIPSYNYGRYILQAVMSCLYQTYKNLEVIVVDDGSTDNTKETLQAIKDRIVYIYQTNQGVSAARNKGLELARGEFIAFLDADDYLTEDSVETRLNILLAYPDIGIVFSETYSEDADGGNLLFSPTAHKDYVSEKFYEDLLIRHLRFQTSAAMMRSSLAKKFRFPTNLSNGEDIAYFTKIFFTTKAYFCVKPTVINRRHPDSLRHNIEEIKRQGNDLIETIFGDPYYNGALEYLRKDFTARRYLEFFKRFYHAGDKTLARKYYLDAISTKPVMILKIDYLIKFLRTCL